MLTPYYLLLMKLKSTTKVIALETKSPHIEFTILKGLEMGQSIYKHYL